ncbi:MAG: hypothetical protein HY040_17195 [Planctomycetes bacterium]|nr:hypothetical protein [Planctomycetota bacterium]
MKSTTKSAKKSTTRKGAKTPASMNLTSPNTALAVVTITNPQSNSNNVLTGGNFTFTGNYNGVTTVHLFLLQAGAANIDMGFANLNQATHTWSLTFGPIAPNPAPAAAYDVQAIGNVGNAADVKQNIRFV